ncbi:twin-arginine translocation signal domain-containing protein, partial [bacterium]|nr:twin-arginine translocation signal domain-containing protein [bacterium]
MISRRKFLRQATGGLAALVLTPPKQWLSQISFPQEERLGRVTVGMAEV